MKNRVKKPVRAAIDRIIAAAFAVTFFELLRQAIRDGHAAQVAMLGGLLLVFGTLDLWDRCQWRRWPQPTELPPPPMVTKQHESVKDARGAPVRYSYASKIR
jgi:hypothetical protein